MILRPVHNVLELGAALRDARTARGWTQAHLAETAGVSRQLVVDVERGRRPGTELSRVLAIARALGLGVTLTPLPTGEASPMDAALDAIFGGDQ